MALHRSVLRLELCFVSCSFPWIALAYPHKTEPSKTPKILLVTLHHYVVSSPIKTNQPWYLLYSFMAQWISILISCSLHSGDRAWFGSNINSTPPLPESSDVIYRSFCHHSVYVPLKTFPNHCPSKKTYDMFLKHDDQRLLSETSSF